ncbi:hypothetical protein EVG20_g10207 [Dentipellis fragilis]|uniref:Uncharacterized protein n=1 Tax=Dentipellis fragilis TaxID=205917 RepID=A0A4Y9XSF8_9AGAM|nr:hypothetical protein EVG20_g10207 [Dentipellis fragilis]
MELRRGLRIPDLARRRLRLSDACQSALEFSMLTSARAHPDTGRVAAVALDGAEATFRARLPHTTAAFFRVRNVAVRVLEPTYRGNIPHSKSANRGANGSVAFPRGNISSLHSLKRELVKSMESAVQRTPPEIWLSIFEQATFVPHAFDTDATDPFDVPSAPHPFDCVGQKELRASLTTKRALILLALETTALSSVSTTLSSTLPMATVMRVAPHLGSPPKPEPNVRIRRFDLSNWSRSELDPSTCPRALPKPDILVRLISYMPHLEIFCELVDVPLHDDATGVLFASKGLVLNALRNHCAISLRKRVLGSCCTVPAEYRFRLSPASPYNFETHPTLGPAVAMAPPLPPAPPHLRRAQRRPRSRTRIRSRLLPRARPAPQMCPVQLDLRRCYLLAAQGRHVRGPARCVLRTAPASRTPC